jgi:hypothetical protein
MHDDTSILSGLLFFVFFNLDLGVERGQQLGPGRISV